jgi:chemotaxis protein histidine kinase CheA
VLEQVTVSRLDVDELFRRFGEQPDAIGRLAARLAARPFGELLSTLPESVERWSRKEAKAIELVVVGREALVPALLSERLPAVLAHLLRNAVAHGIEDPLQRRLQRKPDVGHIDLTCRETVAGVVIEVSDDGAGFDVEALRAEPGAAGHPGTGAEVAFVAGVSTRGVQDDLAGHGVGLDAVRDELDQVGYDVSIVSQQGKGARIVIQPRPRVGEVPP